MIVGFLRHGEIAGGTRFRGCTDEPLAYCHRRAVCTIEVRMFGIWNDIIMSRTGQGRVVMVYVRDNSKSLSIRPVLW